MKSGELQTLTASEPLSLDEEYEMQKSWRDDDNKCTFIILDKEQFEATGHDEIESMVGDVNLFLNDQENLSTAEVEIMIAEPSARRRGLGKEAFCTMMRYGFEELGLTTITAKIGYNNKPSINMFMNLGFQEISRSDVFKEITLELSLTNERKEQIRSLCSKYSIGNYR